MSKTSGEPGTTIRDILEFCARHFDRQDTVEGIAEWWLMEHRVERTVAEVRAAVEQLVEEELMVARRAPDGRVYYRVNQGRAPDIERRLAERQEG